MQRLSSTPVRHPATSAVLPVPFHFQHALAAVRRPLTRVAAFGGLAVLTGSAVLVTRSPRTSAACPDGNAGLTLPDGFCAQIIADTLKAPRHITVTPTGDIFIASRSGDAGVIALRDTSGDGVTDVRHDFGIGRGNDILWHDGSLYFATTRAVVRWRLPLGSLVPASPPDTIVSGLLAMGQHGPKTFALSRDSMLYVMISAPSNTCQVEDRTPQSPGIDPCPWLDSAGGIWRFDTRRVRQSLADGTRYATGVRNIMALSMDSSRTTLFGVQMGRDQLQHNWRNVFEVTRGARNPAEEFLRIDEGSDHGWPYCYFDVDSGKKLLNPEYGGDGKTAGRCAGMTPALMGFPGHWAPEALLFYTGTSFPARYRGGAFVTFHGSFNRAPLPEEGFNISFVPFGEDAPAGPHEVFATGFRPTKNKGYLRRPMGLAQHPDGSLIVTDDSRGRVYRIRYRGAGKATR